MVNASKTCAQLALYWNGQRKVDHPGPFAAQYRVRCGQNRWVAQLGSKIARLAGDADKCRRLRIGPDDPPPVVEQDQRVRHRRDDRLRSRQLFVGGPDTLAPEPAEPDDRKPNLARHRSEPATHLPCDSLGILVWTEALDVVADHGQVGYRAADDEHRRDPYDDARDQCRTARKQAPSGKRTNDDQAWSTDHRRHPGDAIQALRPPGDHSLRPRSLRRPCANSAISGSRRAPTGRRD